MMMVEKNSREVLQPIIDWMRQERDRQQQPGAGAAATGADSLALKLADTGIFWVGTEQQEDAVRHDPRRRRCSCSTSSPRSRAIRCRSCSCTAAAARWCTTWASAGCRAGRITSFRRATRCTWSIVPGHGRSLYHPDALGEIGPLVTYDLLTRDTVTSARCTEQAVAWHDG